MSDQMIRKNFMRRVLLISLSVFGVMLILIGGTYAIVTTKIVSGGVMNW